MLEDNSSCPERTVRSQPLIRNHYTARRKHYRLALSKVFEAVSKLLKGIEGATGLETCMVDARKPTSTLLNPAMDRLIDVLQGTLHPDANRRLAAELALSQALDHDGVFCVFFANEAFERVLSIETALLLSKICMSEEVALHLRQMSLRCQRVLDKGSLELSTQEASHFADIPRPIGLQQLSRRTRLLCLVNTKPRFKSVPASSMAFLPPKGKFES
jgi:hypothetical protein